MISQSFYCPACGETNEEEELLIDVISPSPGPMLTWQCPNCGIIFDIFVYFKEKMELEDASKSS